MDTDAIRRRAEAATPGPWKWDADRALWGPGENDSVLWPQDIDGPNADLIAHARQDIPDLLDRNEKLEAVREEALRFRGQAQFYFFDRDFGEEQYKETRDKLNQALAAVEAP